MQNNAVRHWVRLAGALVMAFAFSLRAAQPPATAPHAEVYQRAAVQFLDSDLLKPAEPRNPDLTFKLAPLIVQELSPGNTPTSAPDLFGTADLSNGVPALDLSHPAVWYSVDSVPLGGKLHPRLTYLWCYTVEKPLPNAGILPMQGVRPTLNSAGQPVIWEILADPSGAEILFVSQTLEAAASAQFGPPLPGRRYSIERALDDAPAVVVARVIEDGPLPMGPIIYLRSGSRSVSTLICRCMPSQGRLVRTARNFELRPFPDQTAPIRPATAAFWPGDAATADRLTRCLRLPEDW